MEFADDSQQIDSDYKFSPSQLFQYLHNILHKDGPQYLLDYVKHVATNFQQAVNMIDHKYNSPFRQTRFKNYPSSL